MNGASQPPVPSQGGRRGVAVGLVGVAVAGACALVALRLHFQPPTIPMYAITSGSDEVVLGPNSRFEIELRPSAPVDGAVAARGFLLRGDEVRAWDPPFSVTTGGAIRIAGPVETLFAGVPSGRWEVAVAIGRPELLPTAPRDILRARAKNPDQGWHLLREWIRLEG